MSFSNEDDIRGLRAHDGYDEVIAPVEVVKPIEVVIAEHKVAKKMGRPSKK